MSRLAVWFFATTTTSLWLLAVSSRGSAQSPPPRPSPIKVLKGTHVSVIGIRADGSVFAWGRNDEGQLGPDAPRPSVPGQALPPITIRLPGPAVDVAVADRAAFAVLEDGRLMSWGISFYGLLGNGKNDNGDIRGPTEVRGLPPMKSVEADHFTVVALARDGSVWGWGSREYGLQGDGQHPKNYGYDGPPILSPVRALLPEPVEELRMSSTFVLARTREGRVYAWGSNRYGALGREPMRELPLDTPVVVPGVRDVVAIRAGLWGSMVRKRDGSLWIWGGNQQAQFGNGQRGSVTHKQITPERVPGLGPVVQYETSLTGRQNLALLADGSVYGWGSDELGQLAGPRAKCPTKYCYSPERIPVPPAQQVLTAGYVTYIILRDGSVMASGDGSGAGFPFPKVVRGFTRVTLP